MSAITLTIGCACIGLAALAIWAVLPRRRALTWQELRQLEHLIETTITTGRRITL